MSESGYFSLKGFERGLFVSRNERVKAFLKLFGFYVLTGFLAFLGAIVVLGLWDWSLLEYPFLYENDSVWMGWTTKTLIATGRYFINPQVGAPGVYQMFDFPVSDGALLYLLKAIGLFSKNWAWVNNVFYLLTYPLSAMTALAFFRYVGLSRFFSIVASVLFALLPYHFQRGEEHLLLSAYFMVPLASLLAIKVLRSDIAQFKEGGKRAWVSWSCYFSICLLAGATGIYYAFFSAFFILIAGGIASFNGRRWVPLKVALLFVGVISAMVIANLLPAAMYHSRNGFNEGACKRRARDVETFGMKITQMILPIEHDHIKALSQLKKKYNRNTIAFNENKTATLGLIASVGFVALLGLAVLKKRKEEGHSVIDALSSLNLSGVLLATTGGFASLFALLVTPSIRSYNRISLFLALFSFAAVFILFEKMIKRRHAKNYRVAHWCYGIVLLLFGVWNQTSSTYAIKHKMTNIKKQFVNEQRFIQRVDAALPENSMIFQLPYMVFPEGGKRAQFGDYDHFKAALHSRRQRWSFGSMKGREVAVWQQAVSALPVEKMVEELVFMGFRGIYLCRSAYRDHAKEIEALLTLAIDSPPMLSESNNELFWNLEPYVAHLKSSQTDVEWNQNTQRVQQQIEWTKRIKSGKQ